MDEIVIHDWDRPTSTFRWVTRR